MGLPISCASPRGEAAHRREPLRAHEALLGAGEVLRVALDLGDLGAQRLLVRAEPLRHLLEARPQLDQLARPLPRRLEPRAPSATRFADRESPSMGCTTRRVIEM